jgi:hypothetical protein
MYTNSWNSIFAQSRANYGHYDEKELPHCNWDWPKGAWFQARRDYVREQQPLWNQNGRKTRDGSAPRAS